jgi:hypothetical protein
LGQKRQQRVLPQSEMDNGVPDLESNRKSAATSLSAGILRSARSKRSYTLEATSDLNNPAWPPLASQPTDSGGIFEFIDRQPNPAQTRYCRSVTRRP